MFNLMFGNNININIFMLRSLMRLREEREGCIWIWILYMDYYREIKELYDVFL